jgi:TatD family hydrolase
MPPLIDSHAHFCLRPLSEPFATHDDAWGDVSAQLLRAKEVGVDWVIAVGGDPIANKAAIDVVARFPGCVRAAVGWDRNLAVKGLMPARIERLLGELRALLDGGETGTEDSRDPGSAVRSSKGANDVPSCCAIGEIGIDLHYLPDLRSEQDALFRAQLGLARERSLPVIVHSREADAPTLDALRDHVRQWRGDAGRIGVLHCFCGDASFACQILDLGFLISFSGIITFKNAQSLRDVARMVPADRLLIETDSPYLAPAPYRGKRNEPAYVRQVAEAMAAARGCSVDVVAECTTGNAHRLFGL